MLTIFSDRPAGMTFVSNRFIDEYMKEANDAQIKVYLYLLRLSGSDAPMDIADIADKFNHTEREVLRSLRYWEKKGLIALDFDADKNLTGVHLLSDGSGVVMRPTQEDRVISIAPLLKSAEEAQEEAPRRRARAKAGAEAVAEFRADKSRAELFFVIEQYVGKPLSPSEFEKIRFIAEELHFSDELIDYLVQYCVDRGKKDFRYIEKVALNWSERGITTSKQAMMDTQVQSGAPRAKASGGVTPFHQFEQRKGAGSILEEALRN